MMDVERNFGTMKWADEYLNTYIHNDFDPYAYLMGEKRADKLSCACAIYLSKIEEATEEFRKERQRIAMS